MEQINKNTETNRKYSINAELTIMNLIKSITNAFGDVVPIYVKVISSLFAFREHLPNQED
jgi:hypothetical protein